MQVQTRGVVLKQTKIMNDRKLLTLFTERYGKISVAVGNEPSRGRTRSSLAYKPFTLGSYDLFKTRDDFRMSRGEVLRSFYKIGEDVDKYLEASFILEFTDKLLAEGEPAAGVFQLLIDCFDVLERRKKEYSFIGVVFQIKAVRICGYMPGLDECVICGRKSDDFTLNIAYGGAICRNCAQDNGLIYKSDSAIIDRIKYIMRSSVKDMEKIYLEKNSLDEIKALIRNYTQYHLEINELKSEQILKKT